MLNKLLPTLIFCYVVLSCSHSTGPLPGPTDCLENSVSENPECRNFRMGFSTWSYGPDAVDQDTTYQFITNNADIYSEQMDDKIPWSAWVNETELPSDFVNNVQYKVSKKPANHKLLLSVSLLNTDRSDLLEDYDGTIPNYTALNDQMIQDAYVKHLEYLITQFTPDYVVIAMEVNDLFLKSATKWEEYKLLMANVRTRIRVAFPDLPLSESVTIHNWFNADSGNILNFDQQITEYINQNTDFVALSFYPFFKGLHTKSEFQTAFDFVHSRIEKPIAFVETTHLAEDLVIENFNTNITSNENEQKEYLEVLLANASEQEYEFLIWWAHRDFDELWETLPDEVKDLGKIWRDTGLLDETGRERPAFTIWETAFTHEN